MQEPRLRQVRGDGITLQLAEWPGAGHTIVCLHGLSANCRWWDTVASGLGACPRKKSLKNNVLELRRGPRCPHGAFAGGFYCHGLCGALS